MEKETPGTNSNRHYAVFVSYRHADNKEQGRQWATWLHQALEGYEIPGDLIGTKNNKGDTIPASLYPVFRDEEELPADADLTRNIQQALERSGLLVVICSPRAAESRFVAEEIRYFKELGNSDRILALMIDGEPNVSDDSGKQKSGIPSAAECLPEPLRYGVAAENGTIDWSRRTEPIAADARPDGQPAQGWTTAAAYREALLKNGKMDEPEVGQRVRDYEQRLELAKLKVVAGALGVPLGILTARDKAMQLQKAKQRARALRRWLAAVAILALLAVAGGVYAWRQKQNAQIAQSHAETEKSRAQAAQEQAEKEKSRAEEALLKTRAALSQSDFLAATRSLEGGRVSDALAQLARSLSFNPRNEASLFRLTTLLAYRDFAAPLHYLKMEGQVQSAQLPPNPDISESAKSILGKNAPTWDAEKVPPQLHPMFKDDPDTVLSFSLSPDERRLFVLSDYHLAQVWDARTGGAIKPPFKYGDRGEGITTVLSPDGKRAVNVDGAVMRLWDTESGKPVAELAENAAETDKAEFSSDSKLLVTAQGESLSLWDGQRGTLLKGPFRNDGTISLIRFSPDGFRVASVTGSAVHLWDPRTGKSAGAPLAHNADVVGLRFSPDGQLIATAARDNSVRIWNAQTSTPVTAALTQSAENSDMLAFAADGKQLLVASPKAFSVWDVPSGKPLLAPLNQTATISSARFDECGERIVTALNDRTARIWNAKTGAATFEPIVHPAEVRWAGFGNGGTLVTLLADVTGRVWDVRPGAAAPTRLKGEDAMMAAQFSHDGNDIIAVTQKPMGPAAVQVWSAATGKLRIAPRNFESPDGLPEISPDGTRLVTRSEKSAQLWDLASGRKVGGPLAHNTFVMSARFSSDGTRVVTASQDKTAKIWNAENGELIGKPFVHDDKLMWAAFSPDGKRIATSAEDKRIRIWDAASGALVSEWEYVTYIASGEFSPDGRHLLTWTMDDVTARIWDVEHGQPVGAPLQHSEQVISAHFSPDGSKIATASGDRTARLWDAVTGKPLTDPLKHPGDVTFVAFSPNGRQIVTLCVDKAIRIWDVETGKLIADPFQSSDAQSAQFSSDGKRLLIVAQQAGVYVWDLLPRNKTAPGWLLTLAETLAGQRLDDNSVFQIIKADPSEARREIEAQIPNETDEDWAAWGRWWLGDRETRKISPFSQITIAEQK
jgi:WD40 repeat protein